jgi:hypothetical protein
MTMAILGASVTVADAVASASATPCPARAALEGNPALTAPIARGLRARGVALASELACGGRTVRAVVSSAAPARGYKLHIDDGFGRVSDRLVVETETAVSLIESWVVDEDADLLAVTPTPAPAAAAVAVATAPSPAPPAAAPFFVFGGPAATFGTDRSVWGAAILGGCGRVGPLCVGARTSVARDLSLAGESADAGTHRTGAELLATASLPLERGRLFALPSVGVGAGWMRTAIDAEDNSPGATVDTFGLRAGVSLLTAVKLSDRVALALDVGATAAPGARPPSPEDSMSTAPSLPGEPSATFHVALTCVLHP